MLQRSSHTPTQENKQTPSSPRKRVKVAWSRGLVKISASWSCVGTWIKAIFPCSTLSLKKWYLTSMCLVFEWSTGFFAMLMALVLSYWSGTWVYSSPKSLMVYVIQRSWEQQLAAAILCLGSGLSNTRLFVGRPRHQRRSQKLASPRCGVPIQPTPSKIRVWKTMKSQRRRRRVQKAEVESVTIDSPYNNDPTVKTSGSRGVYNKFHAYFWY
jgi:hypothetical protein